MEFHEEDQVSLKVTLVIRSLKSKKLKPNILDPFNSLRKIDLIVYKLAFPSNFSMYMMIFIYPNIGIILLVLLIYEL